jgi:hypothetical protein
MVTFDRRATLTSALVACFISACSSTPPAASPSSGAITVPASSGAAASLTESPATAGSAQDPRTTPDGVLALKKAGYTIKNQDGETYYCRAEKKTGSRLQRETVCMTEAQIVSLRDETQRRMGDVMRAVPPPQGK